MEKEHRDRNNLYDPLEGPASWSPPAGPAPPVDVASVEMLNAEMEPEQGSEEVGEDWDELEPESIINRVALFLAHLRSKSSMTLSNLNFVVQHTRIQFNWRYCQQTPIKDNVSVASIWP